MLRRALDVGFFGVVAVMLLHESEHVAQIVQKDVTGSACPRDCRGLLGFVFDVEWVHFAYNHAILLALAGLYLAYGMWRREWRRRAATWWVLTGGIFLVQGYHAVEHAVKLDQWLANGHRSPTPGILGKPLEPAFEAGSFSLIELHFAINTLVLACVLVGWFGYGLHRRVWPGRGWVAVAGVAAALAVPAAIAAVAQPPTVRLAAGVHQGPLVLDRAQKLVGERGAVVRGGILVTASDVTIRNVTVVGGENGIEVDGATRVLLDGVRVRGSSLDGINVRRATVHIRDCTIERLRGDWTQGIDVSYTFDLEPTIISGCTVDGGREGIATHFARVNIRRNVVRDTTLRAIAVTEMSMGAIERNDVGSGLGVGIFCGDYSYCAIARNRVTGTRPDVASDDLTRLGYAIVAHYHARAEVERNVLTRNARPLAAFVGARFVDD